MNFIIPAVTRLALANETLILPYDVTIHLAGRRPLFKSSMRPIVIPEQRMILPLGKSTKIRIDDIQLNAKLLLRRDPKRYPP